MRCREASELMSLSLDETLLAEHMRALKEHLEVCPACQDEWIFLHRLSTWLSSAPVVSPPAGFTTRVMSRLARRQDRPRVVGGAVFLLLGAAVASLLVALLALPPLVELWQTASNPALFVGLEIVLADSLMVIRSLGQALWVVIRALATIWGHALFMSYVLFILLLTVVWVGLIRLQREKSPNLSSLRNG